MGILLGIQPERLILNNKFFFCDHQQVTIFNISIKLEDNQSTLLCNDIYVGVYIKMIVKYRAKSLQFEHPLFHIYLSSSRTIRTSFHGTRSVPL